MTAASCLCRVLFEEAANVCFDSKAVGSEMSVDESELFDIDRPPVLGRPDVGRTRRKQVSARGGALHDGISTPGLGVGCEQSLPAFGDVNDRRWIARPRLCA